MKIRKAVIPAAGLGTRFLPATKAQPKEMLPIVDKPTIQFIVEEAVASGIEDIVIITGRTKKAIEDHFDRSIELELELEKQGKEEVLEAVREISSLANIYYIRQRETLGLGHAISCARTFMGNEPFAVLLGDDIVQGERPALSQLIAAYEEKGSSILGVQQVPQDQTDKYGIVSSNGDVDTSVFLVDKLVEKPPVDQAPSNMAILGRYVLTPSIFQALDETKAGVGGEIQLTDALNLLAQRENVYACIFNGRRYDVGDKLGYMTAAVDRALLHSEFGDRFAQYLANLSLDKESPLHKAITAELRNRRQQGN